MPPLTRPHLVFDLSEVLLPGLFGIEKELSKQLDRSEDEILRAMEAPPYHGHGKRFHSWMTGNLGLHGYCEELRHQLRLPRECTQLFLGLCRNFLDTPYPHTYSLLEALKEKHRLFLISDHMDPFVSELEAQHKFLHFFEKRIWSCQIGATKSEGTPFKILLKNENLVPEACLFIDDHPPNLEVASNFGMRTFHFRGSEFLEDLNLCIKEMG